MTTSHDENRPPDQAARARAYGEAPLVTIRDSRPKPTPQPDVPALLTQLLEGQAAISARLDAIEAAHESRSAEVRRYVLGLHERLYDLHDAIEPLDDATRPDAAIVSLVHNADTTEED